MPAGFLLSRRAVLTKATLTAGSLAVAPLAFGDDAPAPERKPRGRINQSLCQWCYGKMSLDDLCKHAARIGYKSVELVAPENWPTVKKYGLTIALAGSVDIDVGWNHQENHAALIEQTKKNIDLAADAKLPTVICMAGARKGQPDEEGIKTCIAGLKQVAGHAEQRGVNLVMEYLNSKTGHKDYAFDRMAYGVAVAKGVGSERFGLLYDIYHAQIMEGDIIRTIRDNAQYIKHYHTGGNPGRNEIDETQELNYSAIMRAIAETGYKGYVGQEFMPKGDPVKAMENAFRICDV